MFQFGKYRVLLISLGVVLITATVLTAFMTASCGTKQTEEQALDQLRAMTRGGVMPAVATVAKIESHPPNTKVAGLARIVRARIRLATNDPAGAAALLDNRNILQ